jgi:hypothetical protein
MPSHNCNTAFEIADTNTATSCDVIVRSLRKKIRDDCKLASTVQLYNCRGRPVGLVANRATMVDLGKLLRNFFSQAIFASVTFHFWFEESAVAAGGLVSRHVILEPVSIVIPRFLEF